jgi:hypothetical protein
MDYKKDSENARDGNRQSIKIKTGVLWKPKIK